MTFVLLLVATAVVAAAVGALLYGLTVLAIRILNRRAKCVPAQPPPRRAHLTLTRLEDGRQFGHEPIVYDWWVTGAVDDDTPVSFGPGPDPGSPTGGEWPGTDGIIGAVVGWRQGNDLVRPHTDRRGADVHLRRSAISRSVALGSDRYGCWRRHCLLRVCRSVRLAIRGGIVTDETKARLWGVFALVNAFYAGVNLAQDHMFWWLVSTVGTVASVWWVVVLLREKAESASRIRRLHLDREESDRLRAFLREQGWYR